MPSCPSFLFEDLHREGRLVARTQRMGSIVSKRDLYEVLGVAKSASAEEIKRAYRKKARESHPDMNPDDPTAADRFREAEEAYSILSDAQKRQAYDQFGHAAFQQGGGAGGQGAGLGDRGLRTYSPISSARFLAAEDSREGVGRRGVERVAISNMTLK